MPELAEYNLNNLKELSELAAAEAATRTGEIDAAWAYYRGGHRKPLKVRKNKVDDNVIINLARKVVKQSVDMLFGEGLTYDLPGDDAEVQRNEETLAAIWAIQAGKHVSVEKPCCHTVYEGRKLVEAAKKYNVLVQDGAEQRSNREHETNDGVGAADVLAHD